MVTVEIAIKGCTVYDDMGNKISYCHWGKRYTELFFVTILVFKSITPKCTELLDLYRNCIKHIKQIALERFGGNVDLPVPIFVPSCRCSLGTLNRKRSEPNPGEHFCDAACSHHTTWAKQKIHTAKTVLRLYSQSCRLQFPSFLTDSNLVWLTFNPVPQTLMLTYSKHTWDLNKSQT